MKRPILIVVMVLGIFSFLFSQSKTYLSGTVVIDKKQVACYWSNGKRTNLTGGIGTNGSDTAGISIFDGKICVIGRFWNGNTMMPCIWINDEKNDLPIGSDGLKGSGGIASSISTNKNGILIGGAWSKNDKSIPCYWFNGKRIDLPFPNDGGIGAIVASVYLNDEHKYACGFYYSGGTSHACYWIDDIYKEIKIPNETKSGAYKILQSEDLVYICGDYEIKNKQYGYIWENGTVMNFEDSLSALDICEYQGTIYTLGVNTKYAPCYWKGTSKVSFAPDSDGETGYDARKFTIYENKIYACGAYTWDQGYSSQGCYWIDQKIVLLEKESKNVSGIFILE